MKDTKTLVLVQKAKKGNKKAFAALCELKAKEVVFLCVREMGNYQDGQDAAQEVFIQMQKSIINLRAAEAFNVWLNRLVHYTCCSLKSKSYRHRETLKDEAFEDFVMDETMAGLPADYLDAIDSLPDKYRTCITLYYFQQLSQAQVAEVMGTTAETVKSHMKLARKYIRRQLEGDTKFVEVSGAFSVVLGPMLTTAMVEASKSAAISEAATASLSAAGIAAAGTGLFSVISSKAAAIAAAVALTFTAGTGIYLTCQPPASPSSSGPETTAAAGTFAGRFYMEAQEDAPAGVSVGVPGVLLELVSAENPGVVLQAYTTSNGAGGGMFQLENVPDGEYMVKVTLPRGATATADSPAQVSSIGTRTGYLAMSGRTVFSISGETQIDGLDVELYLPARITGQIALRLGGTYIEYDAALLPGVSMQLYDPQGNLVASTPITDGGHYTFENLMIYEEGTYILRVASEDGTTVKIPDEEILLHPGYST